MTADFGAGSYTLISTFGVIGIIVAGAIENARNDLLAQEVNNATRDVDFRAHFWTAITPVIKESNWLKAVDTKMSPKPFTIVPPRVLHDASALVLSTEYFLPQNADRFGAVTVLRFYLRGQPQAEAATTSLVYSSINIGSKDRDDAFARWTANDGREYRRVVGEAVAESAKMLRYALQLMGGAAPKSIRRIKLNRGSIDALILEETADRVLFQASDGHFASVAAKDIDFGGQPSLYAEKQALVEKQRAEEEKKRAEEEKQRALEAEKAAENERIQHWKKWVDAHSSDPCGPALVSLKSAAECVGAACKEPLMLMAGYQKNCHPDPATRAEVHTLGRKWRKETGAEP